jgi:protein-S-isoprenylcysteine O-methyltransferase Ste14
MPSSDPEAPPGPARQLLAVALLPFSVAVVLPTALAVGYGIDLGWALPGPLAAILVVAGVASIAAGLRLAGQTILLFRTVGEGTLAPWDPTRRLVLRGPYRRVRNPMITGVGLILLGEALVLGSPPILAELGVFALANATYIPLVEEPGLVRRFGEEYEEYRRNVPRWLPRRRPRP